MSSFITFPVASTNIFPLSNSKGGGQLVTEFNLRSLDSVATASSIEYTVGPSYTHSERDYVVTVAQDNVGSVVSEGALMISPGKAIINGHYVETLAPMVVDLVAENARLSKKNGAKPLKGKLAVGIRAVYSTEATLAGSMKVENTESQMYEGLQIVVLPENELLLPTDVPAKDQRNQVKAHLKLATFTFYNGAIQNIINNPDKSKYIEADRIFDMNRMLDSTYVKKSLLDPRKIYTFAGKGTDPTTGLDTWCDSLDSLIVWDKKPGSATTDKPAVDQATFLSTPNEVSLVLPHKQVDGMVDIHGNPEYYPPRVMSVPAADYTSGTAGVVTRQYTQQIKSINTKINQFYQLANGKQVGYLPERFEETQFPAVSPHWNIGDYILVEHDYTVDVSEDGSTAPTTLYFVCPGQVIRYEHVLGAPGRQLDTAYFSADKCAIDFNTGKFTKNLTNPELVGQYPQFLSDPTTPYYGIVDTDYFIATITDDPSLSGQDAMYCYVVKETEPKRWSGACTLTRSISLATDSYVGGFYNIPSDTSGALDAGYVYLDDTGHLRLLDYALLRSGTLAYQLGEDVKIPDGLTLDEIQGYLDEYINDRIAFPNDAHKESADNPNLINLYLPISAQEAGGQLFIKDVDSRFGAALYIHLSGEASSNVTINIVDCEKVRISVTSLPSNDSPKIAIYRSSLYYDAATFNYIKNSYFGEAFGGMSDIRIWYEKFDTSDPDLVVDGMTVSEVNSPIISEEVDFWNAASPNDNHYYYALKGITFSSSGDIVGCSMLIANSSTNNIEQGPKIIFSKTFKMPQGYGLAYPQACLTKPLKVTGSFVSAYQSSGQWVVTDTDFTALTGTYSLFGQSATSGGLTYVTDGTIAIYANTHVVDADIDISTYANIPGWEPSSYHIFSGGVIG